MSDGRRRGGSVLLGLALLALACSLVLDWGRDGEYGARLRDLSVHARIAVPAGWGHLGHPWIELLAVVGIGVWVAVPVSLRGSAASGPLLRVLGTVTTAVLVLTVLRATVLRPEAPFESVLSTLATDDIVPSVFEGRPSPGVGALVGLLGLVVAVAGIVVLRGRDALPPPGRVRAGGVLLAVGTVAVAVSAFLATFSLDGTAACAHARPRIVGGGYAMDSCPVDARFAVNGVEHAGWGALGHPWLELAVVGLLAGLAGLATARRGGATVGPVGAPPVALVVLVIVGVATVVRILLATATADARRPLRPGPADPGPRSASTIGTA
ncbi:hypothetical protein AB0L40_04730 [Patulibacter sp. NPDC049589]|uniref:hypothetical protein n=1 Tax=Patulibacter sp. NPDC049589 TaxID=3154731 RepID=UPI0034184B7A